MEPVIFQAEHFQTPGLRAQNKYPFSCKRLAEIL